MRSRVVLLCLLVCFAFAASARAQEPVRPAAPEVKTQAELEFELANANAAIAKLEAQVHELQFQLNLFEIANGLQQQRGNDQQRIQIANLAVTGAQAKAEAEKKKDAKPQR